MKYTNVLNIPQPIADAVKYDSYSAGKSDITVTSLISPPQKVALEKEHAEEITRDVSEEIYALMGKSIHSILERADVSGIKEDRLYTEVQGWKLSGQFDRLALCMIDGVMTLQDYKMASVWEYIFGIKPDRIEQLNSYAELIRRNYGPNLWPQKLQVAFIFRDWQLSKAKRDKDYPQQQVAIVDVPLWESQQVDGFWVEKINEHQDAQANVMRPCTDEERWKDPAKYAVIKAGVAKAKRVLGNMQDAIDWIAENKKDKDELSIEIRPSEPRRCIDYCHAAPFCPQWQNEFTDKEQRNE